MTTAWILPTITGIIGTLVTAGVVIIYIKLNQNIKKQDIDPNMPLIDATARRQFTDGFTMGQTKSIKENKNGTCTIEFFPLDIEQGANKPLPGVKKVVVNKRFIDFYALGESSMRRQIIKILPRGKIDLPQKMRDTLEGDYQTQKGQLAFLEDVMAKSIIPNGDESIHEMMRRFNRGNISKTTMATMMEENAQFRKMQGNIAQEGKPEEKK